MAGSLVLLGALVSFYYTVQKTADDLGAIQQSFEEFKDYVRENFLTRTESDLRFQIRDAGIENVADEILEVEERSARRYEQLLNRMIRLDEKLDQLTDKLLGGNHVDSGRDP